MRNLLKALPLGVCLPLMIAAASVGPEDAVSNISKWTQWLGLHNPPDWLANRSADQWVIVAVAMLYAVIVWMLVPLLLREREKAQVVSVNDQLGTTTIGNVQNNRGIITQGQTGGQNTIINREPEQIEFRTLSSAQIESISQSIRNVPPLNIVAITWQSYESQSYLFSITSILKTHGWTVDNLLLGAPRYPTEIRPITVGWIDQKTPSYEALVAAFRRAKVDYVESELEISGGGKYDAGLDVGAVPMNRLQRAMDQIR